MTIEIALEKHAKGDLQTLEEISPDFVKAGDVVVRVRSSLSERAHLGVLVKVKKMNDQGQIKEGDFEWGEFKEGEFEGGQLGTIKAADPIDLGKMPTSKNVRQKLYRVK